MRRLLLALLAVLGCRRPAPVDSVFEGMTIEGNSGGIKILWSARSKFDGVHFDCLKPGCPTPHQPHSHKGWDRDPFGGPELP